MGKRLVRKLPLLERIKAYPLDLILSLNELSALIEWDDYVRHTLPLGYGLCLLFTFLCKISQYYATVNQKRQNQLFSSDYDIYRQVRQRAISGSSVPIDQPKYSSSGPAGKHWMWLVNSFLIGLATFSTINAIYLFWLSNKDYTLLHSSTSGAAPRASNVVTQNMAASHNSFLQKILSFFDSPQYEEETDSEADTTYEINVVKKDVFVLKVWDPSHFQGHLFATFSPVTLAAVWLVSYSVSFWKLALVIALANALLYAVFAKFFLLVSDRQIVYQETFNEYNRKYVIPKTSVLKKNAIVDATHGSTAIPSMVVHDDVKPHFQNDYAFVRHDINGNRIKSVRADKLGQPPSRPASPSRSIAHNSSFLSRGNMSLADLYQSTQDYNDSLQHPSGFLLSTPYLSKVGHDSFVRPLSPRHSPAKTPTRISFSQRTQLSPSRYSPTRGRYAANNISGHSSSSAFSSRAGSPQRSPSPSKRPWL